MNRFLLEGLRAQQEDKMKTLIADSFFKVRLYEGSACIKEYNVPIPLDLKGYKDLNHYIDSYIGHLELEQQTKRPSDCEK